MQQLEKHIGSTSKKELVKTLEHSNYAFALWRIPNSSKINFIISLEEVESHQEDITQLTSGFVLNRFRCFSEGLDAQFIKADLIVDEESIKIDPKVSDSQLEKFYSILEGSGNKAKSGNIQLNSIDASPYLKSVNKAIEEINSGAFEKVVLSRYKDVRLAPDFDSFNFFEKLSINYPKAFCSLVHLPKQGLWIGASPELLLSSTPNRFKTIALAGTKKIESDLELQEIAWTQKEIEEQAFVSRYIINCFKKLRLREFYEHGPKTIQAGNLAHLKTEFEVKLEEVAFDNLSDQMLGLLHPTSAVCGMPLKTSMDFIKANEGFDRSYFAGFLGPVNMESSTDLFVNLRCMNLLGNRARLFAGAGITQDSIPEKEFAETEIKMQTLLSVING